MILGMSELQFTYLHIFLSLVGIGSGVFVVFGLFNSRKLSIITSLFLVTTTFTSLTGFLFPIHGVTPGIVIGILSLITLLLAVIALYVRKLLGPWRSIYVVSILLSFYFNMFVLVAQGFAKVPGLKALGAGMSSPAFDGAQVVLLVMFILITVRSLKNFNPE